jgi:hypothetical protein
MAFQSMMTADLKRSNVKNKALIDEISTIMLQDYLNRKHFRLSFKLALR